MKSKHYLKNISEGDVLTHLNARIAGAVSIQGHPPQFGTALGNVMDFVSQFATSDTEISERLNENTYRQVMRFLYLISPSCLYYPTLEALRIAAIKAGLFVPAQTTPRTLDEKTETLRLFFETLGAELRSKAHARQTASVLSGCERNLQKLIEYVTQLCQVYGTLNVTVLKLCNPNCFSVRAFASQVDGALKAAKLAGHIRFLIQGVDAPETILIAFTTNGWSYDPALDNLRLQWGSATYGMGCIWEFAREARLNTTQISRFQPHTVEQLFFTLALLCKTESFVRIRMEGGSSQTIKHGARPRSVLACRGGGSFATPSWGEC